MKKNIIVLSILLFLIIACDSLIKNEDGDNLIDINDLEVPYEFLYNTTKNVDINLSVKTSSGDPLPGIVFKIYDSHPEDGGRLISKGITLSDGVYSSSVVVKDGCDSLTVIGYMNNLTLPIINGEISFEYGVDSYDKKGVRELTGSQKAWSYIPGISYNAKGTPSPMTYESLDPDLLVRIDNALPEYSNAPNTHPEYFSSDISTNLLLDVDAEVFMTFVTEGAAYKNSLGYYDFPNLGSLPHDPSTMIRTIVFPNLSLPSVGELQAGDQLQLGTEIFSAGTYFGTFLVSNGWISGSDVSETKPVIYSVKKYYPPTGSQVVVLYDGLTEKIVVAYEDVLLPGGDKDFNDAIFIFEATPPDAFNTDSLYHLTEPIDRDGDGVPDDQDDYPDDDNRAFNNYYPAENVYGTLAFEDNWPNKGDYDFNDIVIDYNFNQVTNASNEVVDIIGSFKLKAVGAGYHNGFGVQLPFDAQNYSGFNDHGNSTIYIDNGTTNAVVIVFQDAFDLMQEPAGESTSWINTVESEPYVTPVELEFTYTLDIPLSMNDLSYQPPYNPFIYPNNNRSKEIHLSDYPPTSKMAASPYWGTGDDDSNSGSGRYYKTSNNLPWAVHIARSWDYPIEKSQITWAYLFFGDWAESGGTVHTNWYDSSIPSNINAGHIYTSP